MSRLNQLLRIFVAFLLVSFLSACDKEQEPAPAQQPASVVTTQDPARFAGQPLVLVDVSEQQINGAATLVLSFSVPLAQGQEFASYITVTDTGAGQLLEPAWVISTDAMELRLRHLPPGRQLHIEVQSGLQAITGVSLQQDLRRTLTTRTMQPMLGFAGNGSLLPIGLAQGLPVQSLNVSEVDVDFYRIHDQHVPAFVANNGGNFTIWSNNSLQNMTQLVYSGRFDLQSEENVQQRSLLPLREISQLQQPGVYYAVMRKAGNHDYRQPATIFSQSNIGLSVHRSQQALDIFALAIDSGKPLPGVEIRLLDAKGNVLQQGAQTDGTGHLRLLQQQDAVMLLARQQQQTSFLPLQRSALDLSEIANISGTPHQAMQLFVFGPRDLYRPGETILLNALLRDADGQQLPSRPLNLRVLTPDGRELHSLTLQAQESGFYQYAMPLAASAPVGRWQFVFDLDGSGNNRVSHDVQVEDFMPERMALELSAAADPLAPADELVLEARGRFLYGAPAVGSEVQGQLFVRPLREAVATLPGYVFGSVMEKLPAQSLDFKTVITDSQGQARLSMDSSWQEARSPLELVARVSLMDSGGRPVTRRQLQPVWPAAQLPGIRPHFAERHVDEDSTATFSLVMADTDGRLQPASGLKVRLIRERRDYYWSYSADSGWRSSYSENTYVVQQREVDLDGNQPLVLDFPVQWGSYRLEVEDPHSGLLSSERFWAGYRWQDSSADEGVRPDQVRLQLDRPAYGQGDSAIVRLEAPHAGSGYVMVESADGPLWWQNIEVPEQGLEVRIPVEQNWQRHDLYVTALVVRPGERSADKTAKRAVGVLHLPLDRSERQLQLQVEAAAQARSGQPLPVRIQVRDADGQVPQQARVLVAAVDVGILNITDFKTPAAFDRFYGRKAYVTDQLDVYSQLIDASAAGLARLRFGGDAAMEQGGDRAASHVKIVAWQSGLLEVDADGYAVTSMQLPDFNGQLRLMVQAWSADSFGTAEQATTVAAPLVAELAMPRFLARGDEGRLALELHNLSGQPQTFDLSLRDSEVVQLLDEIPDSLQLADGERLLLPLRVSARTTGTAQFSLAITGLQLPGEQLPALERDWQLEVRSPWPAQSRRIAALVAPGESWSAPSGWLDGLVTDGLRARLTLSTSPVAGLDRFVRALYEYPYGCSEQTASRLLPLLHLSAQRLSALLDRQISEEQRMAMLQSGIEHLLGMQRPDGSFAMWSASGEEVPWNTVLATDFLQQAQIQGLNVSAQRLELAQARLLRYVREGYLINNRYSSDQSHSRMATQAYAAYVLSQQQPVPLSALRALHARAADAKTPLALVHLAVAMQHAGDLPRSRELLQKAAGFQRDRALWVNDYGSPLSDRAWQIHALNSNKMLAPADLNRRLEQLIDATHGQRWFSTQENAAIFMALHSSGLNSDQPWQASLHSGERRLQLSQEQASHNLRGAELLQPLTLHNETQAALYQVLGVRGYPERYQPQPANVLQIERDYFNLDGSPAQLDKLTSGSVLLVRLQLSASETVRDALVVDLLPAGFELENQNLGQASVLLEEVGQFKQWQQEMGNAQIAMQSFMDDRYVAAVEVGPWRSVQLLYLVRAVTPGSYWLPPVQVQSMYRPDWQAERAAEIDRITIR